MAILGSKDQSSCLPRFIFQKSVTWACPVAMEAFVYVIGAGGSGGVFHIFVNQFDLKGFCQSLCEFDRPD